MHIIFTSWWWPYPANNGAKIRIYNLLRQLAAQHTITLFAFAEANEAQAEDIAHLKEFCQDVHVFPRPQPQPGSKLEMIQGYLSPWPRSMFYTYCGSMAEAIQQVVATQPVDLMIASEVDTIRYLEAAPHLSAILEEVEVTIPHTQVAQSTSLPRRWRAQLTLYKLKRTLSRMIDRGAVITVVSDEERRLIAGIAPRDRIHLIPNGVDTRTECPDPQYPPKPYSVIYTGAITYQPNYEAVAYFIREVWPLVLAQYPQAQFTVTGGTGDINIAEFEAQPGVNFTGYLPSVRDAVRQSWATVVPLKHGGGTRLKILEALALGTPVISTDKGAEGLDVRPGEHLLIANEPEEIAAAVMQLFENPVLRAQLAAAGRELVEQHYDWSVIGQSLLNVVEEVVKRPAYGQSSTPLVQ